MTYLYLGIAILAEVAATTFLKLSDGFSKPRPSLMTVAGYGVAFYFLSLTLRSLPTGVVYAVWSGVGVVSSPRLPGCSRARSSTCRRSAAWA